MEKRYLVIGLKKIGLHALIARLGHNKRNRNYISENVNKELSHQNIVLEFNPNITTDKEMLNYSQTKLKEKNRQVKEDSSKFFEIIIDSSKDSLSEEENIKYLKDSYEYLKKRFKGQMVIDATIHVDEGKPHLHMIFSYFNEEKGKWNQKQLYKDKTTDIPTLLKDFEKEVGKKYNLIKGDKEETKKEIEKITQTIEMVTEKNTIKPNKYRMVKVISPKKVEKITMENLDLKRQLNKIGNKKEIQNLLNQEDYKENREKALTTLPTFLMLEKPDINGNYLIHSPLREDNNKSFSVYFDESRNVWLSHDLSTNETYNNIDLYMKMFQTTYKETIKEITQINKNQQPHQNTQKHPLNQEKEVKPTKIQEIGKNKFLDDYLKERKITKIPTQVKFLEENLDGNLYTYITLKNESDGYSCRNKYIKKNIGRNDITVINNNKEETIVFEGMFDYLSYYQDHQDNVNYLILNSVNNINTVKLQKSREILQGKEISLILDNDEKGKLGNKKLLEIIKEDYKPKTTGIRDYGNFKDYSERHQKIETQKELKDKEKELKDKEKQNPTPPTKDINK